MLAPASDRSKKGEFFHYTFALAGPLKLLCVRCFDHTVKKNLVEGKVLMC